MKICKQTLFPISPPPDKWNFLRQRKVRMVSKQQRDPSSCGPRLSDFYFFILCSGAWCFLLISTTGLSDLEVNCALIFQECAGASGQPIVLPAPGSPSCAAMVRMTPPPASSFLHRNLLGSPVRSSHHKSLFSIKSRGGNYAACAYLRN